MSYGGSGGGSGSLHTDSDVALSNPADGQVLTYNAGLAKWQNQTAASGGGSGTARQGGPILAGDLYVGTNVASPGYYVQTAGTLTDIYAYVGTGPTGSGATIRFNINGTSAGTVTIAAGATSAHTAGLSVAVTAGAIMTWDITAIGSTTAGTDLGVAWTGVV